MNAKLKKFIKRNRKRNARLYQPNLIQGYDYIVCPVSGERLLNIRTNYIVNVLEMTCEEYDKKYPNIQKSCHAHKINIKLGLQKIDNITGLTKHQIGKIKANETLSKIGEDGRTGYQKIGEKTKLTHITNIDEFGRNGYRRQADNRLTTILPNGLTVEQNAHIKQKETILKNNKTATGGASKKSKLVLSPIINFLSEKNIKFYFDKSEYGIKDTDTGNYYFWDLTIPEFQLVIEYQSDAWHANPTMTEIEWNNWAPPRGKLKKSEEVLEYDYNKARALYKNRNFITYYVWQKSEEKDVEDILCLLKIMNTKF